ncbi:MAG TPA: YfhO family protein [Gemmatimonadaceae bacterium]|nr:YfhO family protein [Gemmatimonadaceae bacterium]
MARKEASRAFADAPVAPEAPRFAALWATLTYALCALSLAYPALAGRFLVNFNSDQYKAGYAFREFAARYLQSHGGFPQWNPYLFGGMPYVAAMHGDIFYPTFLLRLVLPTDVAMTWGMILHFFLCGLATYWFLRHAARLSFFAALVGGVAYMMGGFVSSLLSAGHDGKLFVSALFPLTLLVITRGVRDGRKWAWGVLALVTGLAVLTPHPQLLQYLLLGAAAWALFVAFAGVETERLPNVVAVRRLALALGAVLLGGLIGAIQYLPVREYVDWSPRAGGWDYESATQFSFPLEELINTYLPHFSGILASYWGRNGIHFHSEYVGAGVLVLAGAAFGAGWTGARKRLLRFWAAFAAVTLLWALGSSTPVFKLIYAIVPGTQFFRAPSTIFFLTTFAVAVFAALGTERLLARQLAARYAYGWLIGAALVTLFALAGGFTAMAQAVSAVPQLADRIEANAPAVRLGALRSFAFVALAAGAMLLLVRGVIAPRLAGWILAAVCAADLWSIERLYWEFSPPPSVIYASDPAVEFLKKLSQPARVLATGLRSLPMNPYDPFLDRDALMTHRVRITTGYHGNELGRYQQLGSVQQPYDQLGNPTFWALTNTEFLLTNSDTMPIPGARRLVGPVKNAAGTFVSLFLLPGEHPFAWVAPVIMKFPDASVREAVHNPGFPVRSVALFDESSQVEAVRLTTLPSPLDLSVRTTSYEPGRIALALSAPAPRGSALVVSENYYPGWRASVDGKPVAVERADLVLMGIPLPEGARQVELVFSSESYRTGKVITLAALALSMLAVLAGVLSRWLPRGSPRNAPGREEQARPSRARERAS